MRGKRNEIRGLADPGSKNTSPEGTDRLLAEMVREAVGDLVREAVAEAIREATKSAPSARLLTHDEAATYLGVSETTLRLLRRQGAIRAIKLGKCARFDRLELDRLVAHSPRAAR